MFRFEIFCKLTNYGIVSDKQVGEHDQGTNNVARDLARMMIGNSVARGME
jgi:hypothetical protein